MSVKKFTSLFVFTATALALLPLQAQAQGRSETVTWTASSVSAKPGGRATLILQGAVLEGWHVYALKQAVEGPTPLLVSLEANAVAAASGAVSESKPVKQRDAAFGLDTQYFDKDFTLSVPVRVKAGVKPGQQIVPLSVRFQTCNGSICQPPRTVHLSATLQVES